MFYKNFIKVTCISPKVKLGNPLDNVVEIINCLKGASDTSIACLPEMAITGYSINDDYGNLKVAEQTKAYNSK